MNLIPTMFMSCRFLESLEMIPTVTLKYFETPISIHTMPSTNIGNTREIVAPNIPQPNSLWKIGKFFFKLKIIITPIMRNPKESKTSMIPEMRCQLSETFLFCANLYASKIKIPIVPKNVTISFHLP